jgi:hypothetical protein
MDAGNIRLTNIFPDGFEGESENKGSVVYETHTGTARSIPGSLQERWKTAENNLTFQHSLFDKLVVSANASKHTGTPISPPRQ